MRDDHDKKKKDHWRAIAEELGLPTEPDDEPEPVEEPVARHSEPEDEPEVRPFDHGRDRDFEDRSHEDRDDEPEERPEAFRGEEPADEPGPAVESVEISDIGDMDATFGQPPAEEREGGSRRGRRRRRGRRSGDRDNRDQGRDQRRDQGRSRGPSDRSHPQPQVRDVEEHSEEPTDAPHADAADEEHRAEREPQHGGERGERGERGGRRRRRTRGGRHKDRGPQPARAESDGEAMSFGDSMETPAGESDWESAERRPEPDLNGLEGDEDRLAATEEAEERAGALDRDDELSAGDGGDEVVSDGERPTEEDDYDIMDEEDPYADWNIPSWQELIASLYRPER